MSDISLTLKKGGKMGELGKSSRRNIQFQGCEFEMPSGTQGK
jgi:hypothetical protein